MRDDYEPIVCPQCHEGDIEFWPDLDGELCECRCIACDHEWIIRDYDEFAQEREMDRDDAIADAREQDNEATP